MFFIIIGIAILIVGFVALIKFDNPFGVLGVILSGMIIMVGFAPISGHEEPVLQEQYELKVVDEPDIYVIQDSDGDITCKHAIKSEYPEAAKSYGKYTYGANAEIVYTEKNTKPIMKK